VGSLGGRLSTIDGRGSQLYEDALFLDDFESFPTLPGPAPTLSS